MPDRSLTPKYKTPHEMDLLLLEPIHEMMQTGIRVDEAKLRIAREETQKSWDEAQEKLNFVAGGSLNVSSSKQMKEILYGTLGIPTRKKGGRPTANEDALRAIMAQCEEKVATLKTASAKERWMRGYLVCRLALDIRKYRTQIERYLTFKYDRDGRIRSTISIGGTKTMRFSHSMTLWDTGINLATVPRSLRYIFIPDPGYEFAEFDLNRGESWIYSHLAEDPEMMQIHAEGRDFHSETAAAISTAFEDEPLSLDWILANKSGDSYKIRYLAKKVNHASAYRMGPFRGAQVVNAEADDTGITITQSQFKRAQELWLEKYFMMETWWNRIEQQLSKMRTLRTPLGRIKQFHERWGSHLFKEATAYVPQSTSVDYMNMGLLDVYYNIQKPGLYGLKLLTQTHDSILVQYRSEEREAVMAHVPHLLERTINVNGYSIVIPTEGAYGPDWGDLTEWSDAA